MSKATDHGQTLYSDNCHLSTIEAASGVYTELQCGSYIFIDADYGRERASDEHGRLAVSAATNRLAVGDKIRLIPGHCDPTVNLCIRNNRVEQLWPITARGAVY